MSDRPSPYVRRQTTRITGVNHDDNDRRNSIVGKQSTGDVPNAKKPRSRPPTSLRDRMPFPLSVLPAASGPYSVGSMEIEVPVEHPRQISHIKRNGRHLLQLQTVLFTLYYPAAIGSGSGPAPGGGKKWSRETWVPRPRVEVAKGYAKFAGIPDWIGVAFTGATAMLTKLRAYRNTPLATHWPPEHNVKEHGYKVKNEQGLPPEGIDRDPIFPLMLFSHGLGGSKTAYSSLCTEFASYGFVVCAVEHRDGSSPRTFINHSKRPRPKKGEHRTGSSRETSGEDPEFEKESEDLAGLDHTDEELRQGYHHMDYVFPKDNPTDTAPNNERGVDRELRNAQIELRLCELEEAYRVLKIICAGDGERIQKQNRRGEGYIGGTSRGLNGVNWARWKNRFHVDKYILAGHSFGAATVVEALRHTDCFKNVSAGIIYDIWGAPIKPAAEEPEHRIHIPLLGINSEAFMYWQSNFDAVKSLMEEASEHGYPAYLLTVRGSVHITQSDWSLLYRHTMSFLLKATVNPTRALDLNISASLEFLRLVMPHYGGGKTILDRCMMDEAILKTELLESLPDDNRPDDQFIAAKLKVKHEFRTRMASGFRRRMKRHVHTNAGANYSTSDEVWSHYKPTEEQLNKWIADEERRENQTDQISAMKGDPEDIANKTADSSGTSNDGIRDENRISLSDADEEQRIGDSEARTLSGSDEMDPQKPRETSSNKLQDEAQEDRAQARHTNNASAAADSGSNEAPPDTWLGIVPALRDGPQ
ncbi:platelet-activating factor acetylhydrolase, isoform II-domain-containing protein [Phaeosphaeria sp. MPI-PUGE-AT-0046c]|nr:platelet-activating factor acetylhydrolase, isoform II-domain-containing protein [Phaeosphaeria sp. MPI-PUGE-AT-0046c]